MPTLIPLRQRGPADKGGNRTKQLNVSITLLSLSGVYINDRKDGAKISSNATQASVSTATIVASLWPDTSNKTQGIHLHSLPLNLQFSSSNGPIQQVVQWPNRDRITDNSLSTFCFQRQFLCKKQKSILKSGRKVQNRYVPQSCIIQLAISLNGRLFKLGNVDVMINGEEVEESATTLPVINHDQPVIRKKKFILKSVKADNVVRMVRLKGETLSCGLGVNASLQLLVKVSDYLLVEEVQHLPPIKILINPCLSETTWEYDPMQAAVVLKSTDNEASVSIDGLAINRTGSSQSLILTHLTDQSEVNDCKENSSMTMKNQGNEITIKHRMASPSRLLDDSDVLSKCAATISTAEQSSSSSSSFTSSESIDQHDRSELTASTNNNEHSGFTTSTSPHQLSDFTVISSSSSADSTDVQYPKDSHSVENLEAILVGGRTFDDRSCQFSGRSKQSISHQTNEIINVAIKLGGNEEETQVTSTMASCSTATSESFVLSSQKTYHQKQSPIFPFVTDKAKNLGRRFVCGLPVCNRHQENLMLWVDDNATVVNGERYILRCRDHVNNPFLISSSSSFENESSLDDASDSDSDSDY